MITSLKKNKMNILTNVEKQRKIDEKKAIKVAKNIEKQRKIDEKESIKVAKNVEKQRKIDEKESIKVAKNVEKQRKLNEKETIKVEKQRKINDTNIKSVLTNSITEAVKCNRIEETNKKEKNENIYNVNETNYIIQKDLIINTPISRKNITTNLLILPEQEKIINKGTENGSKYEITDPNLVILPTEICIQVINNQKQKTVLTEDLGKTFEMAICLLYGIEYDAKFKYSMEEATNIKYKLNKLKVEFPFKLKHISKNGNKYDFVSIDDDNIHLSAKTTKKNAKVCPQVIGQPSKKKFCEFLGIDLHYNLEQIKNYIVMNVKSLLEIYALNTFDCPIVYYNKHKNMILFVKLTESINWTNYNVSFSHNIKNKKWNESSCIIINDIITIGEFQIHNHRDCIKFRWSFENLLKVFNDNFKIVDLSL